MKRNLTREIVEEKLATVSDSRTDEVLAIAFTHEVYAHEYMELTINAVRRLCGWHAPIALALPKSGVGIASRESGIRRALKELGLIELFVVFHRGERVFIGVAESFKSE